MSVTLRNGAIMPLLGFGTFLAPVNEVGKAVRGAIDIGYRHIDCAQVYNNEKEIGETLSKAFKDEVVKREDLFITSKLPSGSMKPEKILDAFNKTLTDLQLEYLDLYLVHLPVPTKSEDGGIVPLYEGFGLHDVWRKMEEIYDSGKAKSIGVSNFPTILINDLLGYARIKPSVNQIERHPFLPQHEHVKFCYKNGILITAYAPLGAPGLMSGRKPNSPKLLFNETVKKLSTKYQKTPAQILIRWSVQGKIVVIPKSTKTERIKENFKVWDFELSEEDFEELNNLDIDFRYFDQNWMGVPVFT